MYSWYGRKGKISAPQYIDLVMTHIQKHVEDESCLPSKYGKSEHSWISRISNYCDFDPVHTIFSIGLMCLSIEWKLYTSRNSNREQLRKIHQL